MTKLSQIMKPTLKKLLEETPPPRQPRSSLIQEVRDNFEDIITLQSRGIRLEDIAAALTESGIKVSVEHLRNALTKVRKERETAGMPVLKKSKKLPEQATGLPAPAAAVSPAVASKNGDTQATPVSTNPLRSLEGKKKSESIPHVPFELDDKQ